VALVGSDLGLLQKTLRNLKDNNRVAGEQLFAGQTKARTPKRGRVHGSPDGDHPATARLEKPQSPLKRHVADVSVERPCSG